MSESVCVLSGRVGGYMYAGRTLGLSGLFGFCHDGVDVFLLVLFLGERGTWKGQGSLCLSFLFEV